MGLKAIIYLSTLICLFTLFGCTLLEDSSSSYSIIGENEEPMCQLNSNGQITDEWQQVQGLASYPLHMIMVPDGTLYSSGRSSNGSIWTSTTRRSLENSDTWELVENYSIGGNSSVPSGFGLLSEFQLVSMAANNSTSNTVFRLLDLPSDTWALEKEISVAGCAGVSFKKMVVSESTILLGGINYSTKQTVFCKSSDNGSSWSFVSTYQKVAGKYSLINDLFVAADGSILMGGMHQGADDIYDAFILKSTDFGVSWSLMDEFRSTDTVTYSGASVNLIFQEENGRLISGGNAWGVGGNSEVVVRVSGDGGSSWTTSAQFAYASGYGSSLVDMVLGNDGLYYFLIQARDENNIIHAVIYRGSTDLSTWELFEDYTYDETKHTSPHHLTFDKNNNLHMSVNGFDSGNKEVWQIRKYSCVAPSS